MWGLQPRCLQHPVSFQASRMSRFILCQAPKASWFVLSQGSVHSSRLLFWCVLLRLSFSCLTFMRSRWPLWTSEDHQRSPLHLRLLRRLSFAYDGACIIFVVKLAGGDLILLPTMDRAKKALDAFVPALCSAVHHTDGPAPPPPLFLFPGKPQNYGS